MTRPRQRKPERAFGEVVKLARKNLGWSQERLADECDLHRTYISQLERGRKSPTLGAMWRLAAALQIPLPKLIQDTCELTVPKGNHGATEKV